MPFALILIAAIFIVTGFKGTTSQFLTNFASDIQGFVIWVVAIGVIGAIGYVPGLKKVSDGFLALILLAMFLSNKGFFANFNQQIRNPVPASTGANSATGSGTGLSPLSPLQSLAPLSGLSTGLPVTPSPGISYIGPMSGG